MWLVGALGDVWEVAANSINVKDVGTVLQVPVSEEGAPDWASFGFEIPDHKGTMNAEGFKEFWPDNEPGLAYQSYMEAAGMEWDNFVGCWRKSLNDRQYTLYYDHGDFYPHSLGEPCSVRCEDNEGEERYQKPFSNVCDALIYVKNQENALHEPVIEPEFSA